MVSKMEKGGTLYKIQGVNLGGECPSRSLTATLSIVVALVTLYMNNKPGQVCSN